MDKWTDVQAKRMALGGNENASSFFKNHPGFAGVLLVDYKEGMPIPGKYQSEFATFYKEKVVFIIFN
jgi:hypothetical protein